MTTSHLSRVLLALSMLVSLAVVLPDPVQATTDTDTGTPGTTGPAGASGNPGDPGGDGTEGGDASADATTVNTDGSNMEWSSIL